MAENSSEQALAGVFVLILGVPFYMYFRKQKGKRLFHVEKEIGS